jgi:hypothetical protein
VAIDYSILSTEDLSVMTLPDEPFGAMNHLLIDEC